MIEDELIEKLSNAAFEIDSECDAILEARRFLAMMKAYEEARGIERAVASAIREAVEAEREACVAPLEAELKRFDMVRHGTRKPRDLGIEWALNIIRSRSEKPPVTPKEGA